MEKHAMFSGSALVFCWLMISLPHQGKTTTDHFGLKRNANFSKISLEAVRNVEIPWNTTVGCWLFGRLSWPLAQIEIRRKHSGQTLADTIEAFKDRDKYWQPTLDQHVTGMVFPWIFLLQLHQVRQVGSCTTRLWLSMLNASKPVCHQWLHLDANGSET